MIIRMLVDKTYLNIISVQIATQLGGLSEIISN